MVRTINPATLLGHLGGAAEFRHLPSGEGVARLRLDTSRSYRRDDGEWAEEIEWYDVFVWNADRLEKHRDRLRKGDMVHVTRRLRTRSKEDRNDVKRQRTEVTCVASVVIVLAPAAGGARANSTAEDSDGSRPLEGGDGDVSG